MTGVARLAVSHMSPYELMLEFYGRHAPAVDFRTHVEWHFKHGFVYSTPDYFVMGRPVNHEASAEEITNPEKRWKEEECDCWYVHAMCGCVWKAFQIMPWRMPWIAWERLEKPEKGLIMMREVRIRSMFSVKQTTDNP